MSNQPSSYTRDRQLQELHQSAANLTQYACIVSARHIKDGVLRGQFNRDMAYYVRQVLSDVRNGNLRAEEGLKVIKADYAALSLVALDYTKKGVGVVAGGFQIFAGGALCATVAGCTVGLPLALHGGNNVYENAANIWTGRDDAVGPVKHLYQKGAMLLGGSPSDGSVAYGLGDIGFSIHGVFRKVVRPGAFKLFNYIGSDYVRAYTQMKAPMRWFEVFSNLIVLEQIYEAAGESKETKDD